MLLNLKFSSTRKNICPWNEITLIFYVKGLILVFNRHYSLTFALFNVRALSFIISLTSI